MPMPDGSLDLSAFPRFFEEVHGFGPFPWQTRLAELVFDKGWPAALDVPTGAGKTSAIDVAVFHLACMIDPESLASRRAPVRVLFVVDRRIVVDDVAGHAQHLAQAIDERHGAVTRLVAERLEALAEADRRPLEVIRLRGGAPREPDWVRTPTQPIVVVSTVDQVGSRLLFRGYGVSQSMRPVHAGLLGSDSLLLLDEAHLSQPFVGAARAIRAHQGLLRSGPLEARPLQVATLSATQVDEAPDLLSTADWDHPILGRRLLVSKPTRLERLSCKADSDDHIDAIVERARGLAAGSDGHRPQAMAVILNRVGRARRVFDELQKWILDFDVVLLIGRSRPLARDRAFATVLPRIRARRPQTEEDSSEEKPVIIVATQCVEAGADLDFDALVTEIAPLDSLRQRFGRLDRMGRSDSPARALVVATADQVGTRSRPDPVYGTAIASTWSWLVDHASSTKEGKGKVLEIDFGIDASIAWLPTDSETLATLVAPRPPALEVQPSFIDGWSRTSPSPTNEADVSLFLHGPESTAEVQVIWRADLGRPAGPGWMERVAACPPSTWEAVPVPLWEARRWLQGFETHPQLDDLEVSPTPDAEKSSRRGRRILRWNGTAEASELIYATQLRPGNVLVVPTSDGGCDRWGWNPTYVEEVDDLGREANLEHRRMNILRLSPRLLEHDLHRQVLADGPSEYGSKTSPSQLAERSRRWAGTVARLDDALRDLVDATSTEVMECLREMKEDLPEHWQHIIGSEEARLLRVEERAEDRGRDALPVGLPLALTIHSRRAMSEATTENDQTSHSSLRPVLLAIHSKGVSGLARSFAEKSGVPEPVVADLELAGFLHDAGKAHLAFKMWLYGGDELAAAAGAALAKSGRRHLPPWARRVARLPRGARHEVASLAFAEAHPRLQEANDPELVLWLIGTHHGWGRPFFPATDWPTGGDAFSADLGDGMVKATVRPLSELTARWLDLRDDLTARYGPWGLARLEAILRLADHRRSQEEQEGPLERSLPSSHGAAEKDSNA